MVQKTSYDPGTPSWIDIGSRDVPKTAAFYTALFGWEADDLGEEAGHYTIFKLNGLSVAAAGPMMNDADNPAWMTYVSVTDVDASVATAESSGAKVLMAPMDVMTAGRMAVLLDATGAAFSMWQAGDMIGASLVNEPGTFCWSELTTRDVEGAKAFYQATFGWESSTAQMGETTYTEFKLGGNSIAGMMPTPPDMPAQMPASWTVYFAVEDCDATIAKAESLGGSVLMGATDIPIGRFAILNDPLGSTFAVIKFAE